MISTTGTYSLRAFSPGAPPGTFSFDFTFQQISEINAVLYGTGLVGYPLVQGVDFSVSTPAANGTITVLGPNWAGAAAAYGNIRIYRKTAIVNGTSVVNGGAIDANVLEFVIDEITQMMQEGGGGGIGSIFSLTAPPTDPGGLNYILPAASVRANTGLLFDAQGNVIAGSPTGATINSVWQAALAQSTIAGVLSGLGALIVVNTSASNTPAALNGNYLYNVGAAGATSQNFTAGATTAGMTLGVYNSGAGAVTVTLATGISFTLAQYEMALMTWNGATWSSVAVPAATITGTSFTLAATDPRRSFIVNPSGTFTFNAPSAASILGEDLDVVNIPGSGYVVGIAPNGADAIGPAGNVSIYLAAGQGVKLRATASGQLSVVGGIYAPHQSVDTDGTQLELGKLHHLPLGNTTAREIGGADTALPALSAWSSAVQVTGTLGIPAGAKAVKVRAKFAGFLTANGTWRAQVAFSDNNSNTPTEHTAHPLIDTGDVQGNSGVGGNVFAPASEMDVLLNAAGQFYLYTLLKQNLSASTQYVKLDVLGYYMGD